MKPKAPNKTRRDDQKKLGQFMTPASVAKYMAAGLLNGFHRTHITILEPSAGDGSLVSEVFNYLIDREQKPKTIEFTLYEIDLAMLEKLRERIRAIRQQAKKIGVTLKCSIRDNDFLLNIPENKFDCIIANPPYFKLRKNDERAVAFSEIVHGQPNIYGLFMAACAKLVKPNGRYCFLTPRSWTSGPYFTKLRNFIFSELQPTAIHLFRDRVGTFVDEKIQQEMLILWAQKSLPVESDVKLTFSTSTLDLSHAQSNSISRKDFFLTNGQHSVNLPLTNLDNRIQNFPHSLASLGLLVSTGKVVPFRAADLIYSHSDASHVPLIWMNHIQRNIVNWPIQNKLEFIKTNETTRKLLIPNGNYVVVRRFSPKDQKNWVVAAPLFASETYDHIGIENHVNYVYKNNSLMCADEARGIAAYLNSDQVASYLSSRIGHTQINSSDLCSLPTPSIDDLKEIGKEWNHERSYESVNRIISSFLDEISAISGGN